MDRAEDERDLAGCGREISAEFLDKRRTFPQDSRARCARRALETLAEFFSILLRGPRLSVEETYNKTSGCHARRKHHTHYPTRREARFPRFTTPKFPTQIRHMGFRPEPFIF
jgi:hypothetical protein